MLMIIGTSIDVKMFLRFYFGHVFNAFLFSRRFLFLKTLAKFRAASKLTRSTFKITNNEIQWGHK